MKKNLLLLFLSAVIFSGSAFATSTLSITGLPERVAKGDTLYLFAQNGVPPYFWNSSNNTKASIHVISGMLVARDTGFVTISVTDNIAVIASQTIKVEDLKAQIPHQSFHSKDSIDLPILVSNLSGYSLFSAEIKFWYDTNAVTFVDAITAGTLSFGSTMFINRVADTVKIALAGGNPYSGAISEFLYLRFKAKDTLLYGVNSEIRFLDMTFDEPGEGIPTVAPYDGKLTVFAPPNTYPIFTTYFYYDNISEGERFDFQFHAIDLEGDTIHYSINGGYAVPEMSLNEFTGEFSWTPDYSRAGNHNFEIVANDGRGGVTTHLFSIYVQNTNRNPYFTDTPPATVNLVEGVHYSYDVEAYDPDGEPITYSLHSAPSGMTIGENDGLLHWTPDFSSNGEYGVTIVAQDTYGGAASYNITFLVADSNAAPVFINFPSDMEMYEGDTLRVTTAAEDPDLQSISYQLVSYPFGMNINNVTGEIFWAATFSDSGTYTIAVRARDESERYTDSSFTLKVYNVNHTPLFYDYQDTIYVYEGNPLYYYYNGYDPDGDTVTYSIYPKPSGMTFDTSAGQIIWTPDYNQSGSYNLSVKIMDALGDYSIKFITIIVYETNRPPEFTSVPQEYIELSEGEHFEFPVSAFDPDGGNVWFIVETSFGGDIAFITTKEKAQLKKMPSSLRTEHFGEPAPEGMSIDSLTGLFTWTPNYNQAGSYNVTIYAWDYDGGYDAFNVYFTVANVNQAPVFLSALPDTTIVRPDTLRFTYNVFDPDYDEISLTLIAAPPGASLEASGQLTWIPPANANGTYQFIVAANDDSLTTYNIAYVKVNIYGDVSGNNSITAFDASLVLQHLVERITLSPIQERVAEVSGDATVSALDASLILQRVVGLINSFPNGLGKINLPEISTSIFTFKMEKGKNADEFDLIVYLNKAAAVYGISFKLSYDTSLVAPISVARTIHTDSMSLSYFFPSGKANAAFAGVKPLTAAGDVARFSFKVKDISKSKETILFAVNKFVINEQDVTNDVGSIPVNVREVLNIPTEFSLRQNFPNPFNPATTIRYDIPNNAKVRLTIYNMLGQEIKTLLNQEHSAGTYSVEWNGTDANNRTVASGIYLYKLETISSDNSRFVNVKKLILIK